MGKMTHLAAATTVIATAISGIAIFSFSDSDSWSGNSLAEAAVNQVYKPLTAPSSKEQLYFPYVATMTEVHINKKESWGNYTKRPGEIFLVEEMESRLIGLSGENNSVRIIAGGEYGHKNGHVRKAKFMKIQGVAEDPKSGALYAVDSHTHQIRVIYPDTRLVRTLAGSPDGHAGHADGPASEALFHTPHDIAIFENLLFIADIGHHRIRQIDLASPELLVTTLAGNGTDAVTQDGLLSDNTTTFRGVHGVDVGRDGSVYIADSLGQKGDRKSVV